MRIVCAEFRQSVIIDPQQMQLTEIRIVVTPAFPQIPKETITDDKPDRLLSIVQCKTDEVRVLQIFGTPARILRIESKSFENFLTKIFFLENAAIFLKSTDQSRPKNQQSKKVVEMSRL